MHIARVGLRVSDLDTSIDWYGRVAGLTLQGRENGTASMGAPDGGPALLELRTAATPGKAPRPAAGLFHTAFLYRTRPALGAVLENIVRNRETLTGASDHAVSEAIYLDDPDGIGVELYRDRPESEWPPPPPGQKVFMTTEPLDAEGVLGEASGDLPDAANGVVVGHAHLKVSDVEEATRFWTEDIGMDLMATYGSDAAFIAADGYHHHIGANQWFSRGRPLEPQDGPGLDYVAIGGGEPRELSSPDGVRIVVES